MMYREPDIMPTLTIFRHCQTKKGEARGRGSHLSAEGVRHARAIGEQIGPFDHVLTSHIPRTLETALAMGFAVDAQDPVLGEIPPAVWEEIGHHDRWSWDDPFDRFAAIVARGGATAALGRQQQELWLRTAQALPEDGSALLISHGRVIEVGLVACFPTADFTTWGRPLQHGEGVCLRYTPQQVTLARWYRAPVANAHMSGGGR